MTPSRSSSEPRDRTTGSRSHVQHLSEHSKSLGLRRREGSRKSRSHSRSPSSEKRVYKKQKKHSKKRHLKHKKEKEHKKEADDNQASAISFHSVEVEKMKKLKALPVETAPVDAKSFFEQLQKQEAAKKPVGTVHSRGLPAPTSATMISTLDKWECSKAGCGHMNFKHAPACKKCKAMKRMSEWR